MVANDQKKSPFTTAILPNWEGLRSCIQREGTPDRVHFIALFLDGEVQEEIGRRYGLWEGLDQDDPFFPQRWQIALQCFWATTRSAADWTTWPCR